MKQYTDIVEQGIREIGLDPDTFRGDLDGEWSIRLGENDLWIDLWEDELSGQVYFQVVAPVFDVAQLMPRVFYEELLNLNLEMCGVAFCLHGKKVVLKSTRTATGLDVEEVYSILLIMGKYVKSFSRVLSDKYFNEGHAGDAPEQ